MKPPTPVRLRVASFNTALFAARSGALAAELRAGSARAARVAAVLQRVRPDIVLLGEVDHDAGGVAADLLQAYLERPQADGGPALYYRCRHLAPVNTGQPSGLDLDRDGRVGGAGDAWGFGTHPGQYGMLLLSRLPIAGEAVRSFRHLRWSAMPGALRPRDRRSGRPFHPDAIWQRLRLSSKSHWDVPVETPGGRLHLLASHPTPPAFDGPERRNVLRHHDELRLWRHYLDDGENRAGWLRDDAGRCGGLPAGARFVLLGDLNGDPSDGLGRPEAIKDLLAHPRMLPHPAPASRGGERAAREHAAAGIVHRGEPAQVTCDFGPRVFTLRLDYVLPSRGLRHLGGGVFWPGPEDPAGARLAEQASDHRLVWADLSWAAT